MLHRRFPVRTLELKVTLSVALGQWQEDKVAEGLKAIEHSGLTGSCASVYTKDSFLATRFT